MGRCLVDVVDRAANLRSKMVKGWTKSWTERWIERLDRRVDRMVGQKNSFVKLWQVRHSLFSRFWHGWGREHVRSSAARALNGTKSSSMAASLFGQVGMDVLTIWPLFSLCIYTL